MVQVQDDRKDRILQFLQNYGVYIAIVALVVVDTALASDFLSVDNLRVQLFQVVPVLLVALGMALVIGTEGIDLSVGAVIALASAFIPLYLGYGAGLTIVVCLIAGAVSGRGGRLHGRLRPGAADRGHAVADDRPARRRGDPQRRLGQAGQRPVAGRPGPGQPVRGAEDGLDRADHRAASIVFLVTRTTFGRQLVAIGDNRAASQLAGLPVRRVLITVYVISGVLAALAGVLIVGHGAEADPSNYGLNYELSAITAVVVGGTPLTGGKVQGARHGGRCAVHAADLGHPGPAQHRQFLRPDGGSRHHLRRRVRRSGTGQADDRRDPVQAGADRGAGADHRPRPRPRTRPGSSGSPA